MPHDTKPEEPSFIRKFTCFFNRSKSISFSLLNGVITAGIDPLNIFKPFIII